MSAASKLLARRTKGTAYLPGGGQATLGAHLPGGVGTPGVYTPGASNIDPSYHPAIPPPPSGLPLAYQNQAQHIGEQAQQTAAEQLAQIQEEQNQTLSGYGYNATFDPSGALTGLSVDPNNPFSKAALLQRQHDQGQAGNTTSYAARGQLYSGALQNAKNSTDFGFQQASNANQNAVTALLKQFIARRRAATTGATNAATNAQDEALIRALGGG